MANPYDVLPVPDPDDDNDDIPLRKTGIDAAPLRSEPKAANDADASTVNNAKLPTIAQKVTSETTGLKEDLKTKTGEDPPLVTTTGGRSEYVSRGTRVRTKLLGRNPYSWVPRRAPSANAPAVYEQPGDVFGSELPDPSSVGDGDVSLQGQQNPVRVDTRNVPLDIFGSLLGLSVTLGLGAVWAFAFGAGRRVAVGPLGLVAVPLNKTVVDNVLEVDFTDIVAQCGSPKLLDGIKLIDADDNKADRVTDSSGTWTVNADNSVTWKPVGKITQKSIFIHYLLSGTGDGNAVSEWSTLTINFTSAPVGTQASGTKLMLPGSILPPATGQTATVPVSATVTAQSGSAVPTGSVTFTLAELAGKPSMQAAVSSTGSVSAMITIPAGTVPGMYTLTAQYDGDTQFSGSMDTAVLVILQPTNTVAEMAPSIAVPAMDFKVTFSATVTTPGGSPVPTGMVSFTLTDSTNNKIGSAQAAIGLMGAASAAITVPKNTPAGSYTLTALYVVSNKFAGSSDSKTFTITATGSPMITSQPSDEEILVGGTATFTAAATGFTSVQWNVSTDQGKTFNAVSPAATTTTLTVPNTTLAMNGSRYQAVFANASGQAFSTVAKLTVSRVVFVTANPTPQGRWSDIYGLDGYVVAAGRVQLPSYLASLNIENLPPYYAPAAPPPAPTVPASFAPVYEYGSYNVLNPPAVVPDGYAEFDMRSPSLVAATFTPATNSSPVPNSFQVEINVAANDTSPHQLALYFADYDTANLRAQTVTFSDPGQNNSLDARFFANFSAGEYGVWNFVGSVVITVTNAGPAKPVLSGIFLDPLSTQPVFRLSLPPVAAVAGASSTAIPVTVTPVNGFNGAVTLSATNWPNGITATLTTTPLGVTINTTSAVTPGTYWLTLTGNSGLLSANTYIQLTVSAKPAPKARNVMMAAAVTKGKRAAFNVISRGSSPADKDPKSVVLAGLADIGTPHAAMKSALKNDGKTMHVEGEGVWVVDDNNMVAFQADATLNHAPTPAMFRYSDVNGDQSNTALIVADEGLQHSEHVTAALSKQTDQAFWQSFQLNVIDDPYPGQAPPPVLDQDQFISLTLTLAQVVRTQVNPGLNPVSDSDVTELFKEWDKASQDWTALVKICEKAIHDKVKAGVIAAPLPPLMERFWRLALMVRMVAYAMAPRH